MPYTVEMFNNKGNKFKISFTAMNAKEARRRAKDMYNNCEIIDVYPGRCRHQPWMQN